MVAALPDPPRFLSDETAAMTRLLCVGESGGPADVTRPCHRMVTTVPTLPAFLPDERRRP
ncbi:hypothetical protein EYF80_003005 [Liparis tanakae]|uniref:Uncharacterized protein n=1 Tax=Liparis tanakae TaxID=230148 RepID=A0A4Z2JBX0_9TELE|nr:hypothetical protein EYF80_003005 [Liparis tanakae]